MTKLCWAIFAVFLLTRLYFIFTFPPFTDESLYIRWGQLMVDQPDYTFASITQFSRQPLAFWILGYFSMLGLPPLIGARLSVLIANIPVFFLLYYWAKKQLNDQGAHIAVLCLSLAPFAILTQTLALMDGFLFALSSVIAYLIFAGTKLELGQGRIISIGMLLGVSFWIKTTSVFIALLVVMSLAVRSWKQGHSAPRFFYNVFILCTGIALIVTPLFWLPNVENIYNEPGSFLLDIYDIFSLPIKIWASHIYESILGFFIYLGPIALYGMYRSMQNKKVQLNIEEVLWIMMPWLINILIAENFRFRYFSFTFIVLFLLIARIYTHWSLHAKKSLRAVFWFLMGIYSLLFIVYTPYFFSAFPRTSGERDYALGWPSGYGIQSALLYLESLNNVSKPLIIAVADSPGNPSDFILATFYTKPSSRVVFVTISNEKEFSRILPAASSYSIYLVTRSTLIQPWTKKYLQKIKSWPKPLSDEEIGIYRIIP